jgi:hypothetical protein
MKIRIISLVLAFIMILPISAYAADPGDPNIDGGGGGMGSGTSTDSWTPGMDGIRVSIVDVTTGAVMGVPIDYTNNRPTPAYNFGKKNKIHYRNGVTLVPETSEYSYRNPNPAMPRVISNNGNNNIEAVKRYFSSRYVADMIATDFNIPFETLTSGRYKLLLEPIAYFRFQGQQVAMTAHEAALYDQQLSGGLRRRMISLSHQNLPLAMFLERPDLGFSPYSGNTSSAQSNDTILAYLGIGTVTYTEQEEPPPPSEYDIEYRVNTEVVTAVTLHANSEINPDIPATVTFSIMGQSYTMSNIVIPAGESQVVWAKWTTPATEQDVTIAVSTNKGFLSDNRINARIVDLDKNPPPDPKATDRNDSFHAISAPSNPQRTSARWTVWRAEWEEFWVWIPVWVWHSTGNGRGYWCDHGYLEDQGWYNFFTDIYTANLTAVSQITPDDKVPTASGSTMKSGYGVNNIITSSFTTNAPNSHVTGAQTAVSYFPEFGYKTYWRLLELITRGFSSRLEFKQNNFSPYNQRVHYSPIWYPDGEYNVYTYLLDAWTPDGMLSMNLTNSVTIQGSLFDDWRVAPQR